MNTVARFASIVPIALVVLGLGSQALADSCKSPRVKVQNDRAQTIKVTKIQYFDGCDNKWRTEDVPSTEIAAGHFAIFTDNLEYVGNCAITKFKLYRALRHTTGSAYGDYAWGSELKPDEGGKTCNTGVTYTIHADE